MKQQTKPAAPTPAPVTARTVLRDLWYGTATRYTAIALGLLLVNVILNASADGTAAEGTMTMVDPLRFFLLIPFSLLLTVATLVRRTDKLATGAKVALPPLCVLGGLYRCFILPYQVQTKASPAQTMMLLLFALIIYLIVMAVCLLITRRRGQKQVDATPYTRQFGQK